MYSRVGTSILRRLNVTAVAHQGPSLDHLRRDMLSFPSFGLAFRAIEPAMTSSGQISYPNACCLANFW